MPGPLDAIAHRGIAEAVGLFLESVDVNDILRRVDANALLDQVDIDRLLARVDVNALLAQVDVDALLARVNFDAVLARVDIDALLARVDLDGLIERVDLSDVIARSSAGVVNDTVDDVREEAERLEDSAGRWAGHLFHHKSEAEEAPPGGIPPQGSAPASDVGEDSGQA